jgi:uncharacterized protein (DUF169 family)
MSSGQDYSIFDEFDFEKKPVGVKFLTTLPEGIGKLDKVLDFCEMLVEAQEGKAFYATREEFTCIGPLLLGMVEEDPIFESGQVGPKLGAFKEVRANRRIYQHLPRLKKGVINYVVFAPLDKMTFEPDVLVLLASVTQAEILLRAGSYATGEVWSARGTTVAGCSWLYLYPYLTGETNLTVTGLGFGMRARRLFPEGMMLLSVPWDRLPGLIDNLREMDWEPPAFTLGREGHKKNVKRILGELQRKNSPSAE